MKLNGTQVKYPDSFQVEFNDVDSEESYRNAKGEMNRDRIAGDKRKLICSWTLLEQSEISAILIAIKPVYFTVEYYDPELGLTTKTFYAGPKKMPMLHFKNGVPLWRNLAINFIEK